jgi:Leucine-rich repeat (LRR) protein
MRRAVALALSAMCAFAADGDWVAGLGGRIERNTKGAVTAVNLRGSWIADADMDALAAMTDLEKLDLSLTRVTDIGLLKLKSLEKVRELNLFYAELITDEGLAAMRNWTRIERINARGTKVTDNTLAILAGKASVVELDIGFAEVTDSGLQHLARLPNLKKVAFGGNKMTDVGMQVLRALPGLTHLDVSGRQRTDSGLWFVAVTDRALDPVATLADLRELKLWGTQITSRGIATLAKLSKLEKLDVHGVRRVGDDAVPHLAAMASLKWVDLHETGFTAAGVEALRKAKPGLIVAGFDLQPPAR